MATRKSPSRGSPHSTRDSPRGQSPSSSPRSKRNRGTVIVEQSLVSVKNEKLDEFLQRKSTGSLTPDGLHMHQLANQHRKSTGSSVYSDPRHSHTSDTPPILSPPANFLDHTHSTDSLLGVSPPDSIHSSVSSLVDTSSSVSNLTMVTSTEDRLLDELKRQIAHGALRIQELEKQVEGIPLLTMKVDELERERGKLANDLLDSQEIVQSMKQRLSLLHEQNNQLVKLAHSTGEAKGGASAELLRNRNALVASLAQIKKLQERVDSIPSLKAQVRTLTEENAQLKEKESEASRKFPDQLPNGITRATYQSLLEDNSQLKERNNQLAEEVRTAGEQLDHVNSSLEGVKKRMDKFESTRSIVVPLQQRIKRLEKEKDELYQEYVDVKFHQQSNMDIDSAHLVNEVASLKKKNSQLQSKLEQVTIDSRQEKEKLILKLFELESLSLNTQKYDLERQIIQTDTFMEAHKVNASNTNHTPKARRDSTEEEIADLPAESKVQMLKLQQLRLHSEQSRNMLQSLVAERNQLEQRVEELAGIIKQRDIGDLEKSLEESDHKLQLARENIKKLEQELELIKGSGKDESTLEATNKELRKEVERLQGTQSNYEELVANQKQAHQCVEEHSSLMYSLQKAKDDKTKAEKRYKEGKTRLRALAKELSGSVELLQKYQSQCVKLQEQLDRARDELKQVRSTSASYKAKLEVVEAEQASVDGTADKNDVAGKEISYDKLCGERDSLQVTVEALNKTISNQQEQLWKLKAERKENAETANDVAMVTKQLNEATQQLSSERVSSEKLIAELKSVKSALSNLELQNTQLLEKHSTMERESERTVQELHQAKNELEGMAKSHADEEAKLNQLSGELKASQSHCEEIQRELTDKEECLEQEVAKKQQAEEELSDLRAQTTQLANQVSTLNKEKEKLSTHHKQTQEELQLLKQSHTNVTEQLALELAQESAHLQEANKEQKKLLEELETLRTASKSSSKTRLEAAASQKDVKMLNAKVTEVKALEDKVMTLTDEVEGYKATIKSLQRHIEEAESREVEHERLKQNFKKLEKALGTSSHDNKALFAILQQTLQELPNYSSEASRSLQDENLRLEEQVNVLSQWNDKQRSEIETLEQTVERLEGDNVQLLREIQAKESSKQENVQLRRELKEVEMEVGSLRRQARSELQEELQVKLQAQTQVLEVFNHHNTSLQKQVVDLASHVLKLGGTLEREKPVSPPPMSDVALIMPRVEELHQRSLSDLTQENCILKERIQTMEKELLQLQGVSSQFRRRSSSLRALFSVPVGPINEDLQATVPPDMLLPCSLLADYITENNNIQGSTAESWLESIRSEWFACMAQRTLTPASAQCYISTLSRLSARLTEVVVNLQDEQGNTALHYALANGNFPVARQFIRLRCCNTGLKNRGGYTALMLAAACCVDVGEHREVISYLITRGNINRTTDRDQRTPLMLAASSGSLEMVSLFLDKGADVNLKDKDGSTALMFAAQSGHNEIVSLLLSHPHTEHNIKDNDGHTALDIAKEAGFTDLATLLSKHSKSRAKR